MNLQNILTSLADTLARLYISNNEIIMIVTQNQLRAILLDLSGNARDNWWNVIQQASQEGISFIQILEFALLDHPLNSELIRLKLIFEQIESDLTAIVFNAVSNEDFGTTHPTIDEVSLIIDMKFKGHNNIQISNDLENNEHFEITNGTINTQALIQSVGNTLNVTTSLYDAVYSQKITSEKNQLNFEDIKHLENARHALSPAILNAVNNISF